MDNKDDSERFRIDKWLWAARFFKTRSLATAAIECGKVLLNEARVKPAKAVAPGDMLDIRIGQLQFVVEVLALSGKRGSATEAQKLYRETEESRQRRLAIAALLKEQPPPFRFKGRPTKRDRRVIEKFKKET
ncbi:MAG: RNA-binding S4 domain-containing protein [Gallionella sp.]|nr:RNA-binding S4 domain-containing protein [Gallionella sp.]